MTWVHWVLYNLPPTVSELPEGVSSEALPPGTRQGQNDWKRLGYGGSCPPVGRHRYFHKLYALDVMLSELGAVTSGELEKAMQGHVLAKAVLVETYEKGAKANHEESDVAETDPLSCWTSLFSCRSLLISVRHLNQMFGRPLQDSSGSF